MPHRRRKLTSGGDFPAFLQKGFRQMIIDRIALVISIIGALNWGSIGLFRYDIVAHIFGGQDALMSRIIYTVVALAGVWLIYLLFRAREQFVSSH